jgi:NADH kinase
MPPRNVLLVKKDQAPLVTEKFIEYARHIHSDYPLLSIVLEPSVAAQLHESLPFPVYTLSSSVNCDPHGQYQKKVDLVSTLGGDGTILHASSLFAGCSAVPPILSFSMGTLGFLGEWKYDEYKRAFREIYMSGADISHPHLGGAADGWADVRGKSMGSNRNARVLLRNRLRVAIYDPQGRRVDSENKPVERNGTYAMNEVIIHRGRDPHLAIVEIFVGGRFFTEAVADGMIISTPTGSTAYSLSSGGSIVHPLVSSLLLTPICPRSLSFRPLVLPANTPITLRLSEKNRGREVEVSVDGVRRDLGLSIGMELRVSGEQVQDANGSWVGGVPSIVRGHAGTEPGGEDSWVGGLNGLLKFNYPFGEE